MEERDEEEIRLEHGMFALERQEDIAAIIIGIIVVAVSFFFL